MPTVLRTGGYRFFFYMADRFEPPHIHVQREDSSAKLWLDPLEFAFVEGFDAMNVTSFCVSPRRISTCFCGHGMAPLEIWAMNELRIHHLTFTGDSICVAFSDERSVAVPLHYFPRLHSALPAQREQWLLIARGLGVHWEGLDEDLSVENILSAYSRSKASEYVHTLPS